MNISERILLESPSMQAYYHALINLYNKIEHPVTLLFFDDIISYRGKVYTFDEYRYRYLLDPLGIDLTDNNIGTSIYHGATTDNFILHFEIREPSDYHSMDLDKKLFVTLFENSHRILNNLCSCHLISTVPYSRESCRKLLDHEDLLFADNANDF